MTKFANNCTQMKKNRTNLERTYWVRHIVRIFETFANQAGESPLPPKKKERKHWWKEESSVKQEENMEHTIGDTAKQVSSTISMLNEFIIQNLM